MINYLAYGSNLHPLRLRARIPSAQLQGTVKLPGWRLAFHKWSHDGSSKCNIINTGSDSDTVHGAVFNIARHDKARLDCFEGLGNGYDELTLRLPDYGHTFLYIAAATHIDDSVKPYGWYQRFVALGARYHEFPAQYIRDIEAIAIAEDPDPARHENNMRIIPMPVPDKPVHD